MSTHNMFSWRSSYLELLIHKAMVSILPLHVNGNILCQCINVCKIHNLTINRIIYPQYLVLTLLKFMI